MIESSIQNLSKKSADSARNLSRLSRDLYRDLTRPNQFQRLSGGDQVAGNASTQVKMTKTNLVLNGKSRSSEGQTEKDIHIHYSLATKELFFRDECLVTFLLIWQC